jgi:hypothetical protein
MIQHLLTDAVTRAGFIFSRTIDQRSLRELIGRLHAVPAGRPMVRLGSAGDGGYLVPDDLDGLECCFSPGVGANSSFETDLAERGVRVLLADKSVSGPASPHPKFSFLPYFVSSYSDPAQGLIGMEEWSRRENVDGGTGDLILQMDIEGYEYEVIHSLGETLLKRFRIIVAEFHNLHQLLNCNHFGSMQRAFAKLLRQHAVVQVRQNLAAGTVRYGDLEVPRLMEFTFYRRDRIEQNRLSPPSGNPAATGGGDRVPEMDAPACWQS